MPAYEIGGVQLQLQSSDDSQIWVGERFPIRIQLNCDPNYFFVRLFLSGDRTSNFWAGVYHFEGLENREEVYDLMLKETEDRLKKAVRDLTKWIAWEQETQKKPPS